MLLVLLLLLLLLLLSLLLLVLLGLLPMLNMTKQELHREATAAAVVWIYSRLSNGCALMANPLQQEEEEEEEIWSTLHPTVCFAANAVQQQKLGLQQNPKP
jgi:hypothetical protein